MNFLNKTGHVFLDGAMGTMLRAEIPDFSGIPDILSITHPDAVFSVHQKYVNAGSNIIYTNTFGATDEKLEGSGHTLEQVIKASVEVAKKAAGDRAAVALDLGPTGRLMAPAGDLDFDTAYETYRRRAVAGAEAGADLVVLETMSDLAEARVALLAVKENTSLPVFVTMTFESNGRSFTGCSPKAFASLISAMGANAIGINCSLGPDQIYPLIEEIASVSDLPLIVKANAGLPSADDGSYDITPAEFAEKMKKFTEVGVKYLGGCCGTTPDYISELCKAHDGLKVKSRNSVRTCLLGGAQKVVDAEKILVVGERLNPTGKKKLAAALAAEDMDYVISVAREQIAAGADLLDVNVGVPGADEVKLMKKVVETLVKITDLPLQIDSKSPAAIEAGLRAYPGRAIINSVDGEDANLEAIIPLAKKYGAAIIGLTLNEDGIPKKALDRAIIAKKILNEATKKGIPACDIFIDCLTLSVSAEPDGPRETLRALAIVRDSLKVKTALGVSNVSFGLPEREIISSAFLTLALHEGLTLPIINPCSRRMTDAIYSYRALAGIDEGCIEYVNFQSNAPTTVHTATEKKSVTLGDAIISGDDSMSRACATQALETLEADSVINDMIIPALDRVGEKFEKGEFFLPQLMRSAAAASAAVDVIRESKKESDTQTGEKIILATVKGDIHDIGKNIVKMVLSNYGYDIIDLGRDVSPEDIVKCAAENQVKLIGLSALMTTTLSSMEDTIAAIRESGHKCKIMIGGAVLTPEYSEKIGADFYAKDAKSAADIAKKVFSDGNCCCCDCRR